MVRTTLRLLALALSLGVALPVAAQVTVTDSAVGARGTFINPDVPTVEATDANGVPLTSFVTVLDGQAADGPHMLTTLIAERGYQGASVDTTVVSTRGACIEAGAGMLRVFLLSRGASVEDGITQGGDSVHSNMLDVSNYNPWISVVCQPITQN